MKRISSILMIIMICLFSSTMLVGCKKSQDLNADMITLSSYTYTYDGTEKEPSVTVKVNDEIVEQKYYTVSYCDNIEVGQASVTITTKKKNKKIKGSVTVHFDIVAVEFNPEFSLTENFVYNGQNQLPQITILDYELDVDYTLTYEYKEIGADDDAYVLVSATEVVDAGEYKVNVNGKGKYSGTKSATFTIAKADYESGSITVSRADYTYGQTKSDFVLSGVESSNVKYYYSLSEDMESATELTKDTKLDNGKYYFYGVVLESKNYNSFETAVSSFNVMQADISSATLEFESDSYAYTGNEVTPKPVVTCDGNVLTFDVDYILSYTNNINVGTASVIVTGKGNYKNTVNGSFVITLSGKPCEKHTEKEPVIENFVQATIGENGSFDTVVYCSVCGTEISRDTITINKINEQDIVVEDRDYIYNGNQITPNVTVNNLVVDEDFTVSYSNNTNAGIAIITINFIGNYKGSTTREFEIKAVEVEMPTLVGTYTYTGEEQTAELSKTSELYTISGDTQTNAGVYYITVSLVDDKNYVWSDGTSEDLSLKFEIKAVEVEMPTLVGTYTYTGEEQIAKLSKTSELYTISGDTQTNAGVYYITVSLVDDKNYVWSNGTSKALSIEFKIEKLNLSELEITLEETSYTYTGSEFKPEVTVKFNDNNLVENTDYTLSYKDNVRVGKASATIVGKGNFTGTVTKNYDITAQVVEEPTIVGTYTYTGEEQTISISTTSDLYTVSGNVQTNAGTYYATVKLENQHDYVWKTSNTNKDLSLKYEIKRADISTGKITISQDYFDFTGTEIKPEAIVEFNGKTLVIDEEYELSYLNNINVGVADVVAKGIGNYTGELKEMFTIGIRTVDEPTIKGTYTYNENAQTPEFSYTDNNLFTITNLAHTDAGIYKVKVSLNDKENYIWTNSRNSDDIELDFVINKVIVEEPTITGEYIYDGNVKLPTWSKESDLYEIIIPTEMVNAGKYSITLSLKNQTNYKWKNANVSTDIIIEFVIETLKVEEPTIVGTYTYNGSEQTAEFSYTSDEFTISGETQKYAGSYDVVISLSNANYEWKTAKNKDDLTLKFVINKYDLNNAVISLSQESFEYSGNENKPTVLVLAGDLELLIDVDYKVTYSNNKDAGTGYVIITGLANFDGEVTKEFEINPMIVEAPSFTSEYKYTGLEQTFKPSYESALFTVSNNKQTNAGTYDVEVSLISNNYVWKSTNNSEDLIFKITINPYSVKKPELISSTNTYNGLEQTASILNRSDFIVFENDKQTDAGTYEVKAYLADNKNYVWEDGTTDTLTFEFIIQRKGLNKPTGFDEVDYTGEPLYALVNSNVNEIVLSNNVHTNAGTYDVTVSLANKNNYAWINLIEVDGETEVQLTDEVLILPFTINPIRISNANISFIDDKVNFTYTGEAFEPKFTVKFNEKDLVNNVDYTYEYFDNVNVGNAYVLITGKGNFFNTSQLYFYIDKAEVENEQVSLSSNMQVYNGSDLAPTVIVNDGDKTLVLGTDYTISWKNSFGEKVTKLINPDTYEVQVTGINNYTFTANLNFTIDKKSYANITVSKDDYTYSDAKTKAKLSIDTDGNIKYYYSENGEDWNEYTDLIDINAGTYSLYAVIEESTYYKLYQTETISFTVSKGTYTNVTIERNSFDYGSPSLTIINGYTGDVKLYYFLETETIEDAKQYNDETIFNTGKYYIFAVIEESTNYYRYQTEVSSFTVNRISYANKITISREGYTYGDENTSTEVSGYTDDMSYVKYYYSRVNQNYNGTEYLDSDTLNAGTYYIYAIISAHGNYNEYVTETSQFVIAKLTHKNISVVINEAYVYGEIITPSISKELDSDIDYLYNTENVNDGGIVFTLDTKLSVGTYYMYAIIYGDDNVNSYVTEAVKFVVNYYEVTTPVISEQTYTGSSLVGIESTEYYTVSNAVFANAGNYDITLTLKDKTNYIWSESQNSNDIAKVFTILKADMSNVDVEVLDTSIAYSGTAKTPNFSVKYNGNVVENTEYEVSYENNINAGTANIILTAKKNSNFKNTKTQNFTISKIDYQNVLVSKSSYTYGETTQNTLNAEVYGNVTYYYTTENTNIGGTAFTNDTTLNVGTYYIYAIVEESTNYNKYTTQTSIFNVMQADMTGASIVLESDVYSYTGREIIPTIVSVTVNGLSLTKDVDYTIECLNNIEEGTATLIVKAVTNGNYLGSASVNYTIQKMSIADAQIIFENNITEFEYTGSVINPVITVKLGGKTLVVDSDYTLSLANNVNVGTATITITGIGEFSGTKQATFTIYSNSIENATVYFLTTNTTTYVANFTNSSQKSTVEDDLKVYLNDKEVESLNYVITWKKDGEVVTALKNAGTYEGEISASTSGNMTGTVSTKITVIITPYEINASNVSTVKFKPPTISYTGSNLMSSVKVICGNKQLASSDYSIVWKNSNGEVVTEIIEAGEYSAEITILDGNFSYSGETIVRTLTVS